MAIERLVLEDPVRAVMEAAADAAWPEEACGLLIGRPSAAELAIVAAVPSPNLAPAGDRSRRFLVFPRLQAALQRRIRGLGLRLCGAFHSHPQGPARLSRLDRAALPDPQWVSILLAARDPQGRWQITAFCGTQPIALARPGYPPSSPP